MLKRLLKCLGIDPNAKSLTPEEDRSGSYNFGVPTAEDRKVLEDLVDARRRRQKPR